MENILKDINAVSGVTGCFVVNSEGQLLASALPGLFDKTILSTVGRTIVQTMSGLSTIRRQKIGDIDLVFHQGHFIAKNLKDGCLCILCVRNINVPLLNLTANIAVKKLAIELKGGEKPSPSRLVEAPTGLRVDTTFLGQIEQALAKAIGPIATLVVDEEIEALGESRESFPDIKISLLVEKISAEIADEERRLQFTETVLGFLNERRKGDTR